MGSLTTFPWYNYRHLIARLLSRVSRPEPVSILEPVSRLEAVSKLTSRGIKAGAPKLLDIRISGGLSDACHSAGNIIPHKILILLAIPSSYPSPAPEILILIKSGL